MQICATTVEVTLDGESDAINVFFRNDADNYLNVCRSWDPDVGENGAAGLELR